MGKNPDPGSRILDEHHRYGNFYERLKIVLGLKILKFFDTDTNPDPGSFWPWIRDGKIRIHHTSVINIQDPQHVFSNISVNHEQGTSFAGQNA